MNIIWNTHTRKFVLWLISTFLPIKKGRVMCICWAGTKYNCNPKAITDKMIEMGLVSFRDCKALFEVYYAFHKPDQFVKEIPSQIKSIEICSLRYFYLLATSQFIISNTRLGGGYYWPFKKKKRQYYIQTQHGGHGIKKVEFDADLPEDYLRIAKEDTDRTDLMLSDSKYWTNVYRTSYRYKGEVLEVGLPRNDVFFKPLEEKKEKGIRFAIYSPTFRSNGRIDVYGFDYDKVISALETRFGGTWYIRISSHPNMKDYYKKIYDFSHPRLIDVGEEDLQPLLLSSDVLITDYSSAEMDFSLTQRPVFQLCKDREDYDREFYINPEDLPFPYAETDEELSDNILRFDSEKYQKELNEFNKDVIGLKETGHAAEVVVEWILSKIQTC